MAEVRLRGVVKQFAGSSRPALAVDLTIPSGQLVVLVGPSGCGKSTTLRIIAGLEQPDQGRVEIDGHDVTGVSPSKRDVAMVFQNYALYPHMSVAQNLAFALKLAKLPQAEIETRVRETANSLGLKDLLNRKPKQLSGGQRQRVAIGRAVIRNPSLFLFDEPLSNLDAKLRTEMRREIARVHQSTDSTSVYVTHDQTEAMTLADQIVVMRDGLIQQIGTPADIYDRPANKFVAGFFGSPAMNFLDEADRILGIRPEDMSLTPLSGREPIEAAVELTEVLGSEAILHLDSRSGPLRVRTRSRHAARRGERLSVWMDASKAHAFSKETGARL